MPPRKPSMPDDIFGKKPSALDKLVGNVPESSSTVKQQDGTTVVQENSNTVKLQSGNTAELQSAAATRVKMTIYPTAAQATKLDRLALEYQEKTNRRIDRQDIVRLLIDRCTLDLLLDYTAGNE